MRKFFIGASAALLLTPFFVSADSCPNLSRSLSYGSRGTDVVQLQNFLIRQSLLGFGNDTGYFGKLTQAAVQSYQRTKQIVSSGTPSTTGYGAVGPKTRGAIASNCQGASSSNSGSIGPGTLAPQSGKLITVVLSLGAQASGAGTAPLEVTFLASNILGADSGMFTVDFGDGQSGTVLGGCPQSGPCSQAQVSHTYTQAGTFTARLRDTRKGCVPADCNVVASATITVSTAASISPIPLTPPVMPTTIREPSPPPTPIPLPPPTSQACMGKTLLQLKECFAKLAGGQINEIQISGTIQCGGSNACSFEVSTKDRPVKIYGVRETGARITRSDTFIQPIITLKNANNVTISDLTLTDAVAPACTSYCSAPLAVSNSSAITLNRVTVFDSHGSGVEIANTHGITVSNSAVNNASVFGLWFSGSDFGLSSNVRIENNIFKDNRSNAVLFNGTDSVIRNNIMVHNHRAAVFHSCGPSNNDPCGGSAQTVEPGVNNLLIEGNVIRDNSVDDGSGVLASGIEFSDHDIHNVTVRGNDIHSNTSSAVVFDGAANFSNVSITGNKFYLNAQGDGVLLAGGGTPPAAVNGNCTNARCLLVTLGKIYAAPNPCIASAAGGQCASTVSWITNDADQTIVKVADQLFATGGSGRFSTNPSGSQEASWIPPTGATFNLYAGETLLDSTTVFAVSP